MKKRSSIFLFAISLCVSTFAQVNKEKREVEAFTKIEVSKGANVSLIQCDKYELEVVTDGCPTTDVETVVKKGVLNVKMKKRTPGSAVNVFVYFKDIDQIDVKSGASVDTDCLFASKGSLTLNVGSQCEAEMELDVNEVIVDANTCIVLLHGKAKKQFASIYGTLGKSKYDAESLYSEDVTIVANDSEAGVRFTNSLDAESVGAKINYIGDSEKVKEKTSAGGKITKL